MQVKERQGLKELTHRGKATTPSPCLDPFESFEPFELNFPS